MKVQCFAACNVDFADAWLAARASHLRRPVASFDRDLDKFKDIKRFEPTA
jgi:predicted nucleic acid-binding protein